MREPSRGVRTPRAPLGSASAPLTGFTCIHGEAVVLAGHSLLQTLAVNLDLLGVTQFILSNLDLEGTVGDVFAIAEHIDKVLTNFVWGERDTYNKQTHHHSTHRKLTCTNIDKYGGSGRKLGHGESQSQGHKFSLSSRS